MWYQNIAIQKMALKSPFLGRRKAHPQLIFQKLMWRVIFRCPFLISGLYVPKLSHYFSAFPCFTA